MLAEKFFNLDRNSDLFQLAIRPPSCGGGPEFKGLALIGDKFLDTSLIANFNEIGITDSGIITQKKQEFHNERTLVEIGKYLEIPSYLHPIDNNQDITNKDIKETVESLIEVSRKINGEDYTTKKIIHLYEIASERNFLDVNWIGKLNEYYQGKTKESMPDIKPERVDGEEHLPIYEAKYELEIDNRKYSVSSGLHNNKKDCRRETARRMYNEIHGISNDLSQENTFTEVNNYAIPKNIKTNVKISLKEKEIVFTQPNHEKNSNSQINLSTKTGEKLSDWFMRKSGKNPFGTLLLLSARLSDVSGASWSASLDEGELTLLNLSINGNLFFEIGFGKSKSQSKKNAGLQMIVQADIFEWIEKNHPNEMI
ncbi:hypothetical protein DSAG12_02637 [Promethearchaeum syntrophicum]|uniref:Uncharacterized protein n=1 Tax=Promethearchaeum syntrophicum TaxID=2594042 RepID=A0A5B9DD58_9ARCH|nr:hypothetical protein [Candidatus Prometheoarchaeum syntrophicum]QEE16807.1 hypothetical protein DSAG12_02637 [Candidatus Prometheoarchaeum syntrophicum]